MDSSPCLLFPVGDATCSDCEGLSCPGNMLDSTLLTSGYFGTHSPKPPGKCSHGGHFDQSSSQPPRGGINKDSTSPSFSPHHMLHLQAAEVALLASIEAFNLLRSRLGDRGFSRWVASGRQVSSWVSAPVGLRNWAPGTSADPSLHL